MYAGLFLFSGHVCGVDVKELPLNKQENSAGLSERSCSEVYLLLKEIEQNFQPYVENQQKKVLVIDKQTHTDLEKAKTPQEVRDLFLIWVERQLSQGKQEYSEDPIVENREEKFFNTNDFFA